MSELELLLREIEDKWTRENFFRLIKYIREQVILDGDWKVYEIKFTKAETNFKHPHLLGFVPYDIIILQTVGDRNVEFNYDKFDFTNFDITVDGPCYIRFLGGRLKERVLSQDARQNLSNVSIGTPGATGPAGPAGPATAIYDCEASLAVRDWVYVDSSDHVAVADANLVHFAIGVVKAKPTSTTAEVLLIGEQDGFTGLTPGGKIYLSETAGEHTQTLVTTSGASVQILGHAITATKVLVQPNEPRVRA